MRKSPKVTEVLPVLYLRGLSTGDFSPALGEFFGSAAGLSASTVSRLTEAWQAERDRWSRRDLSGTDYVYWWVDGVHFNVRLEEDRLCCLVVVGVRPDGSKELVAVADGYRESKESWAALLRGVRDRGLAGPVLAVGDGALGFWAALSDVFPPPKSRGAGSTRPRTPLTPCQNACTHKPNPLSRPFIMPQPHRGPDCRQVHHLAHPAHVVTPPAQVAPVPRTGRAAVGKHRLPVARRRFMGTALAKMDGARPGD